MMQNISFGLFLVGLVESTKFFINKHAPAFLGMAFLAFIFSGIALRGASRFYKWFYNDVFRISAIYGSTALEVVRKFRKELAIKDENYTMIYVDLCDLLREGQCAAPAPMLLVGVPGVRLGDCRSRAGRIHAQREMFGI